jgi:hypothetical protein
LAEIGACTVASGITLVSGFDVDGAATAAEGERMTGTIAGPQAEAPSAAQPNSSTKWLGLTVIVAATLMNLLDTSVVNVAAPSIRHSLGTSYASLQWIGAAYTLALAVGLLTGGRLGDLLGGVGGC